MGEQGAGSDLLGFGGRRSDGGGQWVWKGKVGGVGLRREGVWGA